MDPMTQPRSQGLDIARGIAVMLMVGFHMCLWPVWNVNSTLYSVFGILGAFRMPVLFLISGYLSASIVSKPRKDAVARVSNLVWIYVLWLPLLLFTEPKLVDGGLEGIVENLWRPWTVLWFIWALSLMITSLFVVTSMSRQLVLAIVLAISTLEYGGFFGYGAFSYHNVLKFMSMFYIGALFKDEIKVLIVSSFTPVMAIALSGLLVGIYALSSLSSELDLFLGGIKRPIVCLDAIYLFKLIEFIPVLAKTLASIGRRTLPVYLTHAPLYFLIRPMIPNLGGIGTPLGSMVILIFASLALYVTAKRIHINWIYEQPSWWANGVFAIASRGYRRFTYRRQGFAQ